MSRENAQFGQLERGAPVIHTIPFEFLTVPDALAPVQPIPTPQELEETLNLRRHFLFPDHDVPYVLDIIRAFRLAKGKSTYLEIGTFDKGNLAYASSLLAPDALIIGVDIKDHPEHTALLDQHKQPEQDVQNLVGNSRWPGTLDQIRALLGDRKLDIIFIDGNHSAEVVMSDYALYSPLLAEDGFLFFHDIFMELAYPEKGSDLALMQIDKLTPVYSVFMLLPVHRYIPNLTHIQIFGGLGIIPGRAWRRP